ncbi:hypothetical protein GUITHDRAFT_146402 [Guillardia theta CCMP2712]|uniref:monoamine oxidase n=1 Tax=Guillardia theta (strain CCMP2712) TaxID=905079 RepID=L1IID1_GUITC|nr:hypothetical protein GUITHDRAFT_146402 [Guillardia theta CCMP2712]EKX35575.1 hypothetical protein GUITHDRAFT_146402 [Guillardia theta CCMP2712]|eukprot:XP_005822555.1 hypothetical protein GUITHDRAFT_146402 [Guillardia theta CCMP2712]
MACTSRMEECERVVDVAVVGGGLSGLTVVHRLGSKCSWVLVEGSSRLGGRLKNSESGVDLGGAWIWPEFGQRKIAELLRELNIGTFRQPDDESSTRIAGGAYKAIEELAKKLPQDRIVMNFDVTSCAKEKREQGEDRELVKISSSSGQSVLARRVVFAAPPRILISRVQFDPPLSNSRRRAMEECRTWMAGVTKVALEYDKRVYDGSTHGDKLIALTFFALAPRDLKEEELARLCVEQLRGHWKMMGLQQDSSALQKFKRVTVQRWPEEELISDEIDPQQIHPHPTPFPPLARSDWDGKLLFASTEADLESPGVMEGAVGAALRVCKELGY